MHIFRRMTPYTLILTCITLVASGCAHLGESGNETSAAGFYDGHWYGPNPENALGQLTCTITSTGDDTWDALFFATFGGQGEYEVELKGVTEGDTIIFEGSVDLGVTSGGVFDWGGTIKGEVFDGSYTSKFINGTFKMSKAEKPADQ